MEEYLTLEGHIKSALKKLEDNNSTKVNYLPIADYVKALMLIGKVDEDAIETNGWQNDFWLNFTVDEKDYTLTGSWYYGNYEIMKGE